MKKQPTLSRLLKFPFPQNSWSLPSSRSLNLKYERNLGRAEGQRVVFVSRVCCGTVGPFLCFSQNVWSDPENVAAWMLVLGLGTIAAVTGRMWHKLDKAVQE